MSNWLDRLKMCVFHPKVAWRQSPLQDPYKPYADAPWDPVMIIKVHPRKICAATKSPSNHHSTPLQTKTDQLLFTPVILLVTSN